MPRPLHREGIISTNGAGTTEYPHTKEWVCIPTSYHTQKSTKNVAKSIRLAKENIDVHLHELQLGIVA